MRKAKAKCQKETKAGRRKHKVALPWCVHISDGKKVLIRNRHCMCPSGWRNRDKCLSPNVDHTLPCSFNDPYNSTDSDRHTDSHFTVELNCSNKQVRLVLKIIPASDWLRVEFSIILVQHQTRRKWNRQNRRTNSKNDSSRTHNKSELQQRISI